MLLMQQARRHGSARRFCFCSLMREMEWCWCPVRLSVAAMPPSGPGMLTCRALPGAQVADALPAGCRLLRMSDVLAKGRGAPEPGMYVAGANGSGADPLVSLFYTSGSTGLPKGAMYSERVWRRYWCASQSLM